MTSNLNVIRFIVKNFTRLQGLRQVPAGLLVIFVALWSRQDAGARANLTIPLFVTGFNLLLYWVIDQYYSRQYGKVTQTKRQRTMDVVISSIFIAAALFALWVDTMFSLPLNMLGLVFAIALFQDFWFTTRLLRSNAMVYYPENAIAAILIFLISTSPILGIPWWNYFGFESHSMIVFLLVGAILIFAGCWGHLRIRRLLL